jgi:hypothetical protein
VAASSTFTMSDESSITGNTATSNGGGVFVAASGTFAMSGGSISGNTASGIGGGGVYVATSGAQFTMTAGSIARNTATAGGGVFVNASGSFTMNGGTIDADNYAPANGNTLYKNPTGTAKYFSGTNILSDTYTYTNQALPSSGYVPVGP